MAEVAITEKVQGVWYWDEADPKTLTIIGALSRPPERFFGMDKVTMDADSYAFPGLDSREVSAIYRTMQRGWTELSGDDYQDDPQAIPKAIINRLRECESEHMRAVLQELGELAGGTRAIVELELQAGDHIEGPAPYEAIPSLQHLSQLAIGRVAKIEDGGVVYLAPGPNGTDAHYFFRHLRGELIGN